MPKGEFSPSTKIERTSGVPSPFASRNSVIRLGLGTAEPALFITDFITLPLRPLPSSGFGGALVSATRTSPFGNT
jgi:hypothetical protein